MEMLERIKGGKMMIFEILLIPLLALVLVAMVFVVGMTGLADSDYPGGQDLSDEIETGEDFPIYEVGYNSMVISLPTADPAGCMFYQLDNQ
jgi:hypothetical protein